MASGVESGEGMQSTCAYSNIFIEPPQLFVGIRFIDFPSSIRLPKFPYELYPSIRRLPISLDAVYLRPRIHFKDVELMIPSNKIKVILLTASCIPLLLYRCPRTPPTICDAHSDDEMHNRP